LTVRSLDEDFSSYKTISISQDWVAYGKYDISSLVSLMRSRRSCRHFLDTPVDRAVLHDLAQIGASAPSGTNCQAWTFTILPDRSAVLMLLGALGSAADMFDMLAKGVATYPTSPSATLLAPRQCATS
jgi:nitroreductase